MGKILLKEQYVNRFMQNVNDIELQLLTSNCLFSPGNVDKGTFLMIQNAEVDLSDYILDLGCGYGVVGIYFAKILSPQNVVMSDIDAKAVEIAKKNAELNGVGDILIIKSDGFKDLPISGFTHIFSNPPYHADFSIPKHFIEKGFNRLALGGKMHMVTKRKDWYKNKLTSIFGGVRVLHQDGYYVFQAEKRQEKYANKGAK